MSEEQKKPKKRTPGTLIAVLVIVLGLGGGVGAAVINQGGFGTTKRSVSGNTANESTVRDDETDTVSQSEESRSETSSAAESADDSREGWQTANSSLTGDVIDGEESDWNRTITYNGEKYVRNSDLTTVLFMGVDSEAQANAANYVGKNGRSDTMLLFVLNNSDKTMQVLQISRDTIVDVDVYDNDRNFLYSGEMQITLQYAFGDSASRSCMLTKNKVEEELLCGIPIDDYASLTVNGMVAIVQQMGGITVTLDEDWTDIDPSYTAGATVTMNGEQVERFVRYRDIEETGSNDVRMERSAWFLKQIFSQMRSMSSSKIVSLYNAAGDTLCTDLDAETIVNMSRYRMLDETIKLPGETREGELHDEYYIDRTALKELLVETFYVKAED